MGKRVLLYLAEGFEEVEALTVVDLLRRSKIEVRVMSISSDLIVKGAHGISVVADEVWTEGDVKEFDGIVLPGGAPGYENLYSHQGVCRQVSKFQKDGKLIAAICAAPTILGRLGLLKGKKASCYPGMEYLLKEAEISTDPVSISDNIITSRGVGTAIDFSLKVITYLLSESVANEIAESICYTALFNRNRN